MSSYLNSIKNYPEIVKESFEKWEEERKYNFLMPLSDSNKEPTHPKFQRVFEKGREYHLMVKNLSDAFRDLEDVRKGTNLRWGNFTGRIGKRYPKFKRFIVCLDDTLRDAVKNTVNYFEKEYEKYKKYEELIPTLDGLLERNMVIQPMEKDYEDFLPYSWQFSEDLNDWRENAKANLYNIGLR
jgi:hypothetical protein